MLQTYPSHHQRRPVLRSWSSRLCLVAAIGGAVGLAVDHAEARPSGGFRGGSFSRPSGGGFSGSGMRTSQRGTRQKPQAAGSRPTGATKGTANGSGNSNRQSAVMGNGNTGVAGSGNTANANSGVVGSGNGNTGVVNNGNVNNGNIGSGNVNTGTVVAGNDVDVSVNSGWTGYGYTYPAGTGAAYATGVAVGTATTAAVVGSYYSTLPASCYPYAYGAYRYYSCSGTWYQQTYKSGSTVYVVVTDPTKK